MREPMPQTHYSRLIAAVHQEDPTARAEALWQLLDAYRPALEAYLGWRFSLPATDATDLVSNFLLDRAIQQNLIEQFLNRRQTNFRGYLSVAIRRYAIDALRRRARGVEVEEQAARPESIDQEITGVITLEWLRQLLTTVLRQVRARCLDEGKANDWELFYRRCLEPIVGSAPVPDYATLAASLGFRSAKEAANRIETMKRRCEASVRAVLAQELRTDDADEIADALREIRQQSHWAALLRMPQVIQELELGDSQDSETLAFDSVNQWSQLFDRTAHGESDLDVESLVTLHQVYLATPISTLIHACPDLTDVQRPAVFDRDWTLTELLAAPQPSRDLLDVLKTLSDAVLRQRCSLLPTPIAFVWRQIAMALAEVRLAVRISEAPTERLAAGVDKALQVPWLDDLTRRLLLDWQQRLQSTS